VSVTFISVTSPTGEVIAAPWLARAERVHLQLRPHLAGRYEPTLRRVFGDGGRMLVAAENDAALGVAIYRIYENTFAGLHLYLDDLVTDEACRSRGIGKALLDRLEQIARDAGCVNLLLDSGTHRTRTHAFYLRERFEIRSFHFVKALR